MQPPHILLVDDNLMQLETISAVMLEAGFATCSAFASPVDALAYAKNNPPDLLITDYKMPILTGGQLLRKLLPFCPNLPAIIITGADTHLLGCGSHIVMQKGDADFYPKLVAQARKFATTLEQAVSITG